MRVTGGTFRSRALRAPRGQATRPTSDRVREALIGILGSEGAIEGARVLDLYAGTGALALEALSRGALRATLVESSRPALAAIGENVAALGVGDRSHVIASDVRKAIPRLAREGPFDLVLADPPWAIIDSGEAIDAIAELVAAGGLSDSATLVLEHASRSSAERLDLNGLERVQSRRYGDTTLTFYKPAILGQPRSEDAGNTSE
jgi:16S rRNA (guanine966-N2)-methyltransferase